MTTLPLDGLQIVECASFVAGPVSGMTLAQLGADVIRVDPIGGRSDRHRWPVAENGESFYWASLNKGKRSMQVDTRSERGRELVRALVSAPGGSRGMLVDNAVGQSWLSYKSMSSQRPDLIQVRVQGHPNGKPAFDYTVNAEIGIPPITGPQDYSGPVNHVLPAWDLLTGMTVVSSLLALLRRRDQTGQGAFAEVALLDVALASIANLGWLSEVQARGADRPRHGNHVYGSFGVDFACADGRRVMVVALTDAQWRALCAVTGTEAVFDALETALGVDLTREGDRYELRETIAAIIRPWFASRDLNAVRRDLDDARVLWGPYRAMVDVVAAHQHSEHPVLADMEMPSGLTGITGRAPVRLDGTHTEAGTVPRLGQDTCAVLAEVLALTSAEIGRLLQDGTVVDASVAADPH